MVFAEIVCDRDYADVHADILAALKSCFSLVESGLQGDSWIWIFDGDDKVAIDTFSSMRHQIKSHTAGPHVQAVITALQVNFDVHVFDDPIEEWG